MQKLSEACERRVTYAKTEGRRHKRSDACEKRAKACENGVTHAKKAVTHAKHG